MRRSRRIFSLLLLLILVVTVLTARRLAHKANLRLLRALSPHLETLHDRGWQVDSAAVKVGALHLYGVRYRGSSPYELTIEDIRIGYSIANLLRSRFRPASLPSTIMLVKPHLIVHFYQHVDSLGRASNTPADLNTLEFLQNVVVVDGRVSYVDSSGLAWQVFDEVDGWLYREGPRSARLQLAARPRGSKEISVEAFGNLDLLSGHVDTVKLRIHEYEIGGHFPFLLPPFLEVKAGRLAGELILTEDPDLPEGFDLQGLVSFRHGEIGLKGTRLIADSIDFVGKILRWNLFAQRARFRLNGNPFAVSGQVENLLNPRFQIQLTSDRFEVGGFLRSLHFTPGTPLKGIATAKLSLAGSYKNPSIRGQVVMRRGRFGGHRLNNVAATVVFQDTMLTISRLRGRLATANFLAQGSIDFRSPEQPATATLTVAYALGGEFVDAADTIRLALRGSIGSRRLEFLAHAILRNGELPVLHLAGSGQIEPRGGTIDLGGENGSRLRTHFSWQNDSANGFQSFRFEGKELDELLPYVGSPRFPTWLTERADLQLIAAGAPRSVDAWLGLHWGLGPHKPLAVALAGTVERNEPNIWSGNLQMQLRPGSASQLEGKAEIRAALEKPRRIEAAFDLADAVIGNWQLGLDDTTSSLQIDIRNAPFPLLFGLDSTAYEGVVQSEFRYRSNDGARNALAYLELQHLRANGTGPYHAVLRMDLNGDSLRIDSLSVRLRSRPLLDAQLGLNLASGQMDGRVRSDTVRLGLALQTLGLDRAPADGLLTLWASIQGNIRNPEVTGEALMSDGTLLFEPFDLARIAFSPAQSDSPGSASGVQLEQVLLTRSGVYRLQGDGFLPFAQGGPLRLRLSGEANILQLFADGLGFLRNPRCTGQLTLELGGTLGSPTISKLVARFDEGETDFSGVLPHVSEAAASLQLESEGFVHLIELRGKMGGEPFRIRNERAANVICPEELQEFRIPVLGATLGVFLFETGPQGVPLNLHGLQEKGNFGRFEFQGADSSEQFVVAGPWEKPLIRGTWRLRDVSFQYPFIEGVGKKRNWFLDFLRRARWHLRLIPVRNVRYVRTIPSPVDNVYVNLLIDEDDRGVLLTGSPEDGTFRLVGRIESTQGFVEYLDMNFRVESAGAEFDRQSLYPVVWGRARATVTDTTGIPSDLYLTLEVEDYTEERRLDELVRDRKFRGRWGRIRFRLSSDNPSLGETEAEILASLGYSDRRAKQTAAEVVGMSADNWLFRPIVRPFEKSLQRVFGLDIVRFRSRIARNFIQLNMANQPFSPWYLVRQTRWEVGKYLWNDLFLLYTGEVETGLRYAPHQQSLGFRHTLGLEYRISPDLILEMVYDYDSLMLLQKTDKRILLRHSFPF